MIHDAMKVAYSSIVGQSIMLLNDKGACIGQLSVINCGNPQEIADEVVAALRAPNRHAYQVGKKVGEAAGSSELLSEIKRLRDALLGVEIYGSDTLSGPLPPQRNDVVWARDGIREMVRRARDGLGKEDD